ncbi:hypothetical protein, partial [Nocardia sp. NPDC004260]
VEPARAKDSGRVISHEEFLRNFPETPVEKAFSSPVDIARSFSLDKRGEQTVVEAYEVALEHIVPFNSGIAESILRDLHREAALNPNRRFAFLGRDGHILAAGVRGRDPHFFENQCAEIVVSRPVMEMVARDYEARTGNKIPLPSSFRTKLEEEKQWDYMKDRITGSWEHFTTYLDRRGLNTEALTVIDNSLRGRTQEVMAHVLDGVDVRGHYAFLTVAPDDPHPLSKKGHVFHLPATHWQGGATKFLPDDENLTFLSNQALCVVEMLTPGPAHSAIALTRHGPDQTRPSAPLGPHLFPDPIDERYQQPRVPEAAKTSILLAASHHAQSGSAGDLHSFPRQVRSWILGDTACDPRLATLITALSPKWKNSLGTVGPGQGLV